MGSNADLGDFAGMDSGGYLCIRHWMVFVIPDKDRGVACFIVGAVQDFLNVRFGPTINRTVATIMPVVAQRGRNERIGWKVRHVKFGVGPDLGAAEIMVVMCHSCTVRVGAKVIECGNVLRGIAARRTTSRCSFHVISGSPAGKAHLPENVVVG